jgi:hypothetical protein
MAVIWVTLCAVHTVVSWPLRCMDWLLTALAPGMLYVAWRADGGEGIPPYDDGS